MKINNNLYNLDAVDLAKKLLGKILVRKINGIEFEAKIVEVEAYNGINDKANHAFGGLRTLRTEPMFMEGGHIYIFLIYGMYSCFNIVCGNKNEPHAVLIRAVEPLNNLELIKNNRNIKSKKTVDLTNGPGKLCKALMIDKSLNKVDLKSSEEIYIKDNFSDNFDIVEDKRINIDYAEEYKNELWRFYIKENPFVSVK